MAAILSFANKRLRVLACAVLAVFILFVGSRSRDWPSTFSGILRPKPPPEPPKPKFNLFGIEGFGAEVAVATLNIKAKEAPIAQKQRPLQQELPSALPEFSNHRLDDPDFNEALLDVAIPGTPPDTITVDYVPDGDPPDASCIIFGAATTLSRLPDALRGFKHWASQTKTKFVVIIEPYNVTAHPDEPSPEDAIEMYKQAGISLTLVESTMGYLDRYVSLIGTLYDHLEVGTQWVSIIDDDTFFFNLHSVLDMLAKYDTSYSWYVGATSENKWNLDDGGIFAIGGAGIFMSRPLIETLGSHSDDCVDLPNGFGDSRVADCVFEYTTTKLTHEHGLYQLDLHGDVTGFYEAVRPQPVSVHHWKTWHHHDMPTVAAVSSVCGKACVLQNFRFQDGYQMANGFSIVKYSYNETMLAQQIPEAMEHTWKLTIWDIPTSWKYSLAPLKPKDEGKIQYVIEKSVQDSFTGALTQYYVKRKDGYGDSVIRVVWHGA
jgi:hypothetical protein